MRFFRKHYTFLLKLSFHNLWQYHGQFYQFGNSYTNLLHVSKCLGSLKNNLPQLAFTFSKLTIGTWRCSGVFIVNFEHISHLVLVPLLLTLRREMPAGSAELCLLIRWKLNSINTFYKGVTFLHKVLVYFLFSQLSFSAKSHKHFLRHYKTMWKKIYQYLFHEW